MTGRLFSLWKKVPFLPALFGAQSGSRDELDAVRRALTPVGGTADPLLDQALPRASSAASAPRAATETPAAPIGGTPFADDSAASGKEAAPRASASPPRDTARTRRESAGKGAGLAPSTPETLFHPMNDTSRIRQQARWRLIGSIALSVLVVLVFPLIADDAPPPPVDAPIRLPGETILTQDFTADSANLPRAPNLPPETRRPPDHLASAPVSPPAAVASPAKPSAVPAERPDPRPSPEKQAERRRAEEILSGRFTDPVSPSKTQYVILIGAFSNPENVRSLQMKLEILPVKTFTEPFDAPDGKKTRLRAGPFPTESAAEQALAQMKKIGVTGVIVSRLK